MVRCSLKRGPRRGKQSLLHSQVLVRQSRCRLRGSHPQRAPRGWVSHAGRELGKGENPRVRAFVGEGVGGVHNQTV